MTEQRCSYGVLISAPGESPPHYRKCDKPAAAYFLDPYDFRARYRCEQHVTDRRFEPTGRLPTLANQERGTMTPLGEIATHHEALGHAVHLLLEGRELTESQRLAFARLAASAGLEAATIADLDTYEKKT